MKVFISHKKEDSLKAKEISEELKKLEVITYLDLLDESITFSGNNLTQHIKKRLNECTDLLVVISEKTKKSWWVPFEIGMASQKDFPIVNFLLTGEELPSYLEYWPRLKTISDLAIYVKIKSQIINEEESRTAHYNLKSESPTLKFYEKLKAKL